MIKYTDSKGNSRMIGKEEFKAMLAATAQARKDAKQATSKTKANTFKKEKF